MNNDNNQPGQFNQPAQSSENMNHPMAVMQPGERVICVVKRHPIGMLGIYFTATFMVVLIATLGLYFVPSLLTSSGHYTQSQAVLAVLVIVLGIAILVSASIALAHYIYWQNRWIVTTDSITQVTQLGVFRKRTSQLSLASLEDVTVDQNGLLPTAMNYGTLRAETAGERSKFAITFTRNPNTCAREILNARELFMNGRSMEGGMKQEKQEQPYSRSSEGQSENNPQNLQS